MFSVATAPTYPWPIKGSIAGGLEVDFEATFRRLTASEAKDIDERVASGEMNDAALVARALAGWSGVLDERGEPLPFTPQNLFRLLDVLGMQALIVSAFYESLSGARRKN